MLMTFFREEHEIFRKTVREFVQKEIVPYVREWEAAELFPRELFKKCGQMGLFGVHYPEDVGGLGGDYWYSVVWGEELARSTCAGVSMALRCRATWRPRSS